MMDEITNTLKSDTVKESGKSLMENVIGIFSQDPFAALSLADNLRKLPSTIRDGIFFECLETFLMSAYQFNPETRQFEEKNLQALAIALAEASPNPEADYEGDPEKLYEYGKRLIKLIDDCGTRQKAYYLGCLTRALLNKQINTADFFQLSRCIRSLTEEDLLFLSGHVNVGDIPYDADYIDDYRALGLIYEIEGGFSYSMRAFKLKKYVLCYEQHVALPESLPQRREQLKLKAMSVDKLNAILT